MKKQLLQLLLLVCTTTAVAQHITGDWYGELNAMGTKLPLVFHITKTDTAYSATIDSPKQKSFGAPFTSTGFENKTLTLEIKSAGIRYVGVLEEEAIIGTFIQNSYSFPLNLSREATAEKEVKHPQEPKEPFPYYTEEVTFQNTQATVDLAGTLSLPKKEGKFPAVILITGSGPQNRDGEILGNKPFLVISDYLTRNGIAVLRYDDRGVGESTGDFAAATSADFATDVEAAMAYLKTRKEIDASKIGLVGHSEGGLIAPMVAADSKDVAFIVLLAGPGVRGYKILLKQQERIARVSGASEEQINKSLGLNKALFEEIIVAKDLEEAKINATLKLNQMIDQKEFNQIPAGVSQETFVAQTVGSLLNPWFYLFYTYDPAPVLEQVRCPVLAVNGGVDLQVDAEENLSAIKMALEKGGNSEVTIKEFPGLNHLFQESETGTPSEYGEIEQTFSPVVLKEVTDWILQKTN